MLSDSQIDHERHLKKACQCFFNEAGSYLSAPALTALHQAFDFAKKAHASQKRESGVPYITHPLAVATQLVAWRLDVTSLVTALLHDVIEDTLITEAQLSSTFGEEVAHLVDGLSKFARLEKVPQETAHAENFRKIILASAKDIRVILIKLADRLHNMQTLAGITRQDKRQRIAEETLHIYAPLARKIGFYQLCCLLEDLAFEALFPNRYRVIQKALQKVRFDQSHAIDEVLKAIQEKLAEQKIAAKVIEYDKNVYRIYRKMQEKKIPLFDILDLYSCQIVVNDKANCYATLGALHSLYKPIANKIKDYIAVPKTNHYQGLHTTLFGPESLPIEVQIFTEAMYKVAEFGIVTYWKCASLDQENKKQMPSPANEWLPHILAIEGKDATDFLTQLKTDLLPNELYVFTAKGKILTLPRGATIVDFAYALDQATGEHCFGAQVNHVDKPLDTILRHGDIVELRVDEAHQPDPNWLNFVVSHRAIAAIRHYMKGLPSNIAIKIGSEQLSRALSVFTHPPIQLTAQLQRDYLRLFAQQKSNFEAVLAEIGMGYASPIVLSRQLVSLLGDQLTMHKQPIRIAGNEGGVVFASCCQPIPGDAVIGFVNAHNGLIIHQHRCKYMKHIDPDQSIKVALVAYDLRTYETVISVLIYDELNALAKIAAVISQASANIEAVSTQKTSDNYLMRMRFRLRVHDTVHVDHILAKIGQVGSVLNAERCGI